MSRSIRRFVTASMMSGAVLFAGQAHAAPITVDSVGDTFAVSFNGVVDDSILADLTAEATFAVTAFTLNSISFDVTLINTTGTLGTGLNSRISGLAFNTSPNVTDASSTGPGGLFTQESLPGMIPGPGYFDVCLHQSPQCQGSGAGLFNPNSLTLAIQLDFVGPITNFTFDAFAVRYQSIGIGNDDEESGYGMGRVRDFDTPPPPIPAPEPASLLLLGSGLAGLAVWRFRRRTQG